MAVKDPFGDPEGKVSAVIDRDPFGDPDSKSSTMEDKDVAISKWWAERVSEEPYLKNVKMEDFMAKQKAQGIYDYDKALKAGTQPSYQPEHKQYRWSDIGKGKNHPTIKDPFGDPEPQEDPNQFEKIRQSQIEQEQQAQAIVAQQQQAELQKKQQEEAFRNDPRNMSSTQFKKASPAPQTMEEQAIFDATIQAKKAKEKQLAESLLPEEVKKTSVEIDVPTDFFKEVAKGTGRGGLSIASSIGDTIQWIGQNIGSSAAPFTKKSESVKNLEQTLKEKVSKYGEKISEDFKKKAMDGVLAPDPKVFQGSFTQNPSWTRAAAIVAEAIPSLAYATAISFATGNPVIGASSLGLLEGSGQFAEAKKAGKTTTQANIIGGLSTIGNSILEAIPINRFLKGGSGKAIKDIFQGAFTEGTQEVAQQLYSNLIAKIGYEHTRELTLGWIESLIGGAGSGGIIGGLTSGRGIKNDQLIKAALNKGVSGAEIDGMIQIAADQLIENSDKIDQIIESNQKTLPEEVRPKEPIVIKGSEATKDRGRYEDMFAALKKEFGSVTNIQTASGVKVNVSLDVIGKGGLETFKRTKADDNVVYIDTIESSEKGKGNATKVLDEIIKIADKNQVELRLFPRIYKKDKGQMDLPKLYEWYKRKGFTSDETGMMSRKPIYTKEKTSKETKLSPKDKLISDIDQAIKKAPERPSAKTLEVLKEPLESITFKANNAVYKLENSKEALTEFKKRIEKGMVVGKDLQTGEKGRKVKLSDKLGLEEPSALEPVNEETKEMSSANWQVELSKDPKIKKQINKTQIIRFVEDALGVPVRSKLTHRMSKAAGYYFTRKELIRLKRWGELEVLTHEVAHHVDMGIFEKKYGKDWWRTQAKKGSKKSVIKELADLDYDQNQRRTEEGFAEFMRHYLTDTGKARQYAPNFYDLFFNKILKEKGNSDIANKLEKFKKLYEVWNKQGALNRFLGHIDFKGEHTKDPVQVKARKAFNRIYEEMVDELYVLKRLSKEIGIESRKNVRPTQDPYEMATYMKQKASGIARTFVTKAAVDEYGNVVGKSLADILKPVIGNKDIAQVFVPRTFKKFRDTKLTNFIAYWVAQRAMFLETRRGIESGFDRNDAKYIIEKFKNPEWDNVASELNQWSDHLVDWVVRSGGLSQEAADYFRTINPVYVPFKRAFLDDLQAFRTGGKTFTRSSGFNKIKGSGRPIINPIESLMGSASELISKAHKIRLTNIIADLAERQGAGGFITKIPLGTKVTKIKSQEILKKFIDMGLELKETSPGVTDSSMLDEVLPIFTKTSQYKKENVVPVFRNGELSLYEIHPDLYKALQGVMPIQMNGIMKVLSMFTRFKRLGATGLNPIFGLGRNPIKDFLTASVFSKHKTYTPLDPFVGLVGEAFAKPGSPAYRFKAMGGDLSSMMGYDRAQVMTVFDDVLLDKLKGIGKTLKIVRHPIDTLRQIFNIPEMAPRIREMQLSMEKYRKDHPDWTDEDVFVAAFNDAQDITINFSRSGRTSKRYNQLAFAFNASIQGINKFYRSLRENPIKTVVNGIAYLSIPAAMLWFKNKDEEWYKNLEPAYKYNNLFWEWDDTVYRIPIPYDVGTVFSSMVVAGLDVLNESKDEKDKEMLDGLWDIVKAQAPLNYPDIVQPSLEVLKNKNWLNRPIEPIGQRLSLPSQKRLREDTPRYAVYLSEGFNELGVELSPLQIEHLVNSYSGGLTKRGISEKIEMPEDVPFFGSFVQKLPNKPSRQLENFYNQREELQKKKNADIASLKELRDLHKINLVYKAIVKPSNERIEKFRSKKDRKSMDAEYSNLTRKLKRQGFD